MPKSSLRAIVLPLLLVLLCVPAATRATQTLQLGQSANPTSGFSKSVNVPPDPICIDAQLRVVDLIVNAVAANESRHPAPLDEPLPASPPLPDTSGPRAPPASAL